MKLVHHSVDDLGDLIHKGHDASLQNLRRMGPEQLRWDPMCASGTWMGADGRVLIVMIVVVVVVVVVAAAAAAGVVVVVVVDVVHYNWCCSVHNLSALTRSPFRWPGSADISETRSWKI